MARTETGIESELAAALAPLSRHRYSIKTWTVENMINNSKINVKKFIKAVNTFTFILNSQTRYELLKHSVASGLLSKPEEVTIKMFYEFCIWLKTKEGIEIMFSIDKDAFTMNFAIEGMLITAFRYNSKRKAIKAVYDEKIGKIRRKMVLVEKDMEEELESLADEFNPEADYENMDFGGIYITACKYNSKRKEIKTVYDEKIRKIRRQLVWAEKDIEKELESLADEFAPAAADYEKMMVNDDFTMGCVEVYKSVCNRRQANYMEYILDLMGGRSVTAEERQEYKARVTQRVIDQKNKR